MGATAGLQANGVLQLTGGVLGSNVVTQNLSTTTSVTSSGPGQCLVTIDLGSIGINALNLASVDLPTATITGKGSGAVGSLLCNPGNLLSGLVIRWHRESRRAGSCDCAQQPDWLSNRTDGKSPRVLPRPFECSTRATRRKVLEGPIGR